MCQRYYIFDELKNCDEGDFVLTISGTAYHTNVSVLRGKLAHAVDQGYSTARINRSALNGLL